MNIRGRVIIDKTPGRSDPWVKKQVSSDYFAALKITEIDGQPVTTTQDMFNFIQKKLPTIVVNAEVVNDLFTNPTLPRDAKDMPHITLGNFPDFRLNRSVDQEVDPAKVAAALDIAGLQISFDLTNQDFELVIASKNPELVAKIRENDIVQFKNGSASVVTTPTVGMNRDAIFNLKPGPGTQIILSDLSKLIFGKDFELWNSQSKPVPYHLTVAQADQLTAKLEVAAERCSNMNDVEQRKSPVFSK